MKIFLSCLASMMLFLVATAADELGEAKQRIQSRQGDLASLKDRGVLGENNRGYVELRGADTAGAGRLASDENRDREVLYSVVAKRTGTSTEQVGRARAREIAQSSRPGVWVQDDSGRWAKK